MKCVTYRSHNRRRLSVIISMIALSLSFASAFANDKPAVESNKTALIEAGRLIAEKQCVECHAIGKQGKSTHKEAPPFRNFSKKWPVEVLEESLAEGIMTGHNDMPEVRMSPEEITAFISYLKSLEE